LFCDLSNADGSILSDQVIAVFETVENLGEDVVVDYYLCQVSVVPANVR
jgi:hypothetical protein